MRHEPLYTPKFVRGPFAIVRHRVPHPTWWSSTAPPAGVCDPPRPLRLPVVLGVESRRRPPFPAHQARPPRHQTDNDQHEEPPHRRGARPGAARRPFWRADSAAARSRATAPTSRLAWRCLAGNLLSFPRRRPIYRVAVTFFRPGVTTVSQRREAWVQPPAAAVHVPPAPSRACSCCAWRKTCPTFLPTLFSWRLPPLGACSEEEKGY